MEHKQINGEMAPSLPQPRLIPHVVSERAKECPNKIWGALPKDPSDASQGYEDITFARMNYAIIGPQRSRTFEALAYLGPPDSRYVIFAIAAIKADFQVRQPLRIRLWSSGPKIIVVDVVPLAAQQ